MAASSEVVPSQLYPLIYRFLSDNGLTSTLKSFKKEIKGKLDTESLNLEEIAELTQVYGAYLSTQPAPATNGKDKKKKDKKEKKEKKKAVTEQPQEEEQQEEQESETPSKKEKKTKNKKNKREENNNNEEDEDMTEATPAAAASTTEGSGERAAKKAKSAPNTPFKRVRDDEVEISDPRLLSNAFEAKGGDAWGAKASADLVIVRGKDFRHAKTKKKKGSYRGGSIDTGVNSIKFNYDDEE